MKKVSIILLLILHLFYPLCLGIATAMGWELTLSSDWGFILLLTAATIGFTYVGGKSVLLFPVTVINGLCSLWCTRWLLTAACVICWCVCGGILFRKAAPKGASKALTLFVTVPLIVLLLLSCPVDLFVETMGYICTVQEVDSPDGTYTAHLIDSNDGALGGDTLVKVYDNTKTVNLLIGSFVPEPKLVYQGEWGEFKDIKLFWKDDNILTVNGQEYPMS